MSLKKLHNNYVDYDKISFVGIMDSHVKAHIGVIIHFFLIIVDGHPIEVQDQDKDVLVKARNQLIADIEE